MRGDESIASRPVIFLPQYLYTHQNLAAHYEGPAFPNRDFAYSVASLVWLSMQSPRIFLLVIYLKFNKHIHSIQYTYHIQQTKDFK